MFVRGTRPHHIWLLRVGFCISGVSLHHIFGLSPNDHDMRACLDPVVVWGCLSGIRIGIAGAVVASKHVDKSQLLWCWALVLPSLSPFHGCFVCTHWGSTRVHARPPVVPLFDDLHRPICAHA